MAGTLTPYVELARRMDELPAATLLTEARHTLPPLDDPLLHALARRADTAALARPRHGWELLLTAALANRAHATGPLLQAQTDLQLSRAATYWGLPRRAAFRAQRAAAAFRHAGQPAWEAAAIVALNAAAWMRPNFQAARAALADALPVLAGSPLCFWQAEGLHALAFAEMLTGALPEAGKHLEEAIARFEDCEDAELPGLRARRTQTGWLWRSGAREKSLAGSEALRRRFEALAAQPDLAVIRYQFAMRMEMSGENYPAAELELRAVQAEFEALEMDLWAAQAQNGVAQTLFNQGRLTDAAQLNQAAAQSFQRHGLPGLLADALNDRAVVLRLFGDLPASLHAIERAIDLYGRVGAVPSAINAMVNRGRFLLDQARYQQALTVLEEAQSELENFDRPELEAYCELQLGLTWLGLENVGQAEALLNSARDKSGLAGRWALQAEVLQTMAHLEQSRGAWPTAYAYLEEARSRAQESADMPVLAATQRLLAEAHRANEDWSAARTLLEQNIALTTEHGLELELASSLAALGEIYEQRNQPGEAQAAWAAAMQHSQGALPALEARLQFSTARQTAASGNTPTARTQAMAAVTALKQIRRDFWQPRLAAGYARSWEEPAAWCVALAAQAGDLPASLHAIEASKAQSFIQRELSQRNRKALETNTPASLRAKILWLMDELRAAPNAEQRQELRQRLGAARQAYDEALERAERQALAHPTKATLLPLHFNPEYFRQQANEHYGRGWLALDYHLAGETLTCAWLSNTAGGVVCHQLTARDQLALEACERIHPARADALRSEDLARLSDLLLPSALRGTLAPESALLIAPYGRLHAIPWATLPVEDDALITRCLPIVIPSLEAWLLLASRSPQPAQGQWLEGVVVAVTEFENHLPALPGSNAEADLLASLPGLSARILQNAAASPAELTAALGAGTAAFLHIATHLFADRASGRFSGIAFERQTLLLDELQDIPGMPALVFLSGCNGTRALAFTGEERQDFVSAFLLGGARQVVGSQWPVADDRTLALVAGFYAALMETRRPTTALAHAQRQQAAAGAPWPDWAGFQCVGI